MLRARHSSDLFAAEVNMGSAWGGCRRLDAWVLKRTWRPVTTIGYEIKVSRSDFLRDDKWRTYLDACHAFAFVCPHGLITPEELPADVGLIWVSKTGSRLYTKRKAVHRNIELPAKLMVYLLMSRTKIVADMHEANREDAVAYWEGWLEERKHRSDLGHRVSRAIRENTQRVVEEARRLRNLHEDYDHIRQRIEELGFDPNRPLSTWSVDSRLRELRAIVPADLISDLRRLVGYGADVANALEKLTMEDAAP